MYVIIAKVIAKLSLTGNEFIKKIFLFSLLILYLLFSVLCIQIVCYGYIKGYIIFGGRGREKVERELSLKSVENKNNDILKRDSIVDYYLKGGLDDDVDLSSNDIFHLRKSIGLQNDD